MKNKILLFSLLLIGASAFLFSFERPAYDAYIAPGGTYRYAVTDTITNAEKDTITLPANFASLYTGSIFCPRTNLSGTTNVKLYLDESNLTSGTTDWVLIDSTSTTGATVGRITKSELTGARYRIRVSGTGTQSTRYALTFLGKKKN